MKRATVLGAVLLSLTLIVSGCGAGEKKGNETTPVTGETTKPAESTPATAAPGNPESTYAIVAGESSTSFEVKEVFLVDALNVTAIGKTSAITGNLVVENGTFKPSTVVVDVTTLKTDQGMRDRQLKSRAIETDKYKTAEFTVEGVEGGAIDLSNGQEATFKLKGVARIHGVEKPLVWDAKAKLEGDTLKLDASVEFDMALFEIEPPNVAGRIRVDEMVKLNVAFVAKRG